jgi:cell wall-associated NlpC family hydrolase
MTVLVVPSAGHADPAPTISQVKAQVDTLYAQGEEAAERANEAQDAADAARLELETLRANLAKAQENVSAALDEAGTFAAAQYRASGLNATLEMVLTADPDALLSRMSSIDQLTAQQARAITNVSQERAALAVQERAVERESARLDALTATLDAAKAEADQKLAAARALLNRLTAEEKARIEALRAAQAAAQASRSRASQAAHTNPVTEPSQPTAPAPPVSGRAGIAVAFAMAQIGKPYRYGGTGPGSYDCSGLTMAAWRAAGVSLPHSSSGQYHVGTHVSASQLKPGDLVFYYSPIHHVGMYIGNGMIVHAPNYGHPVGIAPLYSMPFVGATRVG